VTALVDANGPLSNFVDPDGNSPGVAIVDIDENALSLWISDNTGLSWIDVGVPTENAAVVLASDPAVRIYLQTRPDLPSYASSLTLSYKLWDGTGGHPAGSTSVDTRPEIIEDLGLSVGSLALAVSSDNSTLYTSGNYLGEDLVIIDLSDLSSPSVVSQTPLNSTYTGSITNRVAKIVLSPNEQTAVVLQWSGVSIFDITNSASPQKTGVFATNATGAMRSAPRDIALSSDGTLAYVVSDSLRIYQLQANGGASLLGSTPLPSVGYSVTIAPSGTHALVADEQGGMQTIDVSTPTAPQITSTVPTELTHYTSAVAVSSDGSTAFIGSSTSYGYLSGHIMTVDIRNPFSPVVLAQTELPTSLIRSVTLDDSSNVLQVEGNSATYFVDVGNASQPAIIGSGPIAGSGGLKRAQQFSESGNSIVFTDELGLQVVATQSSSPFSVLVDAASANLQLPPSITSITGIEAIATTNQPYVITVSGSNFDPAANVTVTGDGVSVSSFQIIDPSTATLTATFSATASSASHAVTVQNPDGQIAQRPVELSSLETQPDNPSFIEVSGSTELTVGRSARFVVRFFDPDNAVDSLLGQRVPVDWVIHEPPRTGDITVLDGRFFFYDAGPAFDGEDSFVVRTMDRHGGVTDHVITISGEPSRQIGLIANIAVHQNLTDTPMSYRIPAVGVDGAAPGDLPTTITVTSSNSQILPAPAVVYAAEAIPSYISFSPVAGASGSVRIALHVEDGGADRDLATPSDNGQASHTVDVTVLEVISGDGAVVLSKDEFGQIYADTHPITQDGLQATSSIAGFSTVGADSGNVLLVQRNETTSRLIAEDGWKIGSLFHSLSSEQSGALNPAAREPQKLSITAVPGAYVIDGLNNPTITVRRGQRVTFDLSVTGHPFYLQTIGGGYTPANVYAEGFTGNGETTGRFEWIVPEDAPDELFYQCEFHPVMFGKIVVVD